MYKIDFAKQLDENTSGVTIKGKIVFNKDPKNIVSKPGAEKTYDFWSQFIAIEDPTGSIGANITFGEEKDKKTNGEIVEVKGTIYKYEAQNKKTGEMEEKVVLNSAKVIEPKNPKEETKESKTVNVSNSNDILPEATPEEKDQYIRENAIEIVKDLIVAKSKNDKGMFELADEIFQYIKTGKVSERDGEINEKTEQKTDKEDKEESKKIDGKKLNNIIKKAEEIGLKNWWKITEFAIKSNVFKKGTDTKLIKEQLSENDSLYNKLIDAIQDQKDIDESIKENTGNEPTEEIPF